MIEPPWEKKYRVDIEDGETPACRSLHGTHAGVMNNMPGNLTQLVQLSYNELRQHPPGNSRQLTDRLLGEVGLCLTERQDLASAQLHVYGWSPQKGGILS